MRRDRDAVEFNPEAGRVDLYLEFPRGSRFPCPEPQCPQRACPVHDTEDKTWRHLDFFQYQAFLHAKLPRVRCAEHGVRQVTVSWVRPGSGFTLLFEALLITFAGAMPVARVSAHSGWSAGPHRPGRLANLDLRLRLGREHDTIAVRTHAEILPSPGRSLHGSA